MAPLKPCLFHARLNLFMIETSTPLHQSLAALKVSGCTQERDPMLIALPRENGMLIMSDDLRPYSLPTVINAQVMSRAGSMRIRPNRLGGADVSLRPFNGITGVRVKEREARLEHIAGLITVSFVPETDDLGAWTKISFKTAGKIHNHAKSEVGFRDNTFPNDDSLLAMTRFLDCVISSGLEQFASVNTAAIMPVDA